MTAPIKLGQEWGPNKKWVYSTKPVDLRGIDPSRNNNFGFLAIPKLNKADIKRYKNFLAILKEKVLIAPRKEKPAMVPFFHGMTPEEVRNKVKKTPNLFAGKDKKGGLSSVALADKGGFSWGSASKNDGSKTKKVTKIDKAQMAAVRAGAGRRGGRRGGRARRRTQRGGVVVGRTVVGAAVVPGDIHRAALRVLWGGPGGGGGYWGTPAAAAPAGGTTAVVIFRPSPRGGMQIRNADGTTNFKVAVDINIFSNAHMRAGADVGGGRGRFTGIIPVASAVAATGVIPAVTPRTPGGILIDTYRTFYTNNPGYPRTDFYEMVVPGPNGAAVPLDNMFAAGNPAMNYTGDCNSPAYQQIFGQNPPAAQGGDAAAVAGAGQCPNQLQKYVFHRAAGAAAVAGLQNMGNALGSAGWGQLWNGITPRGPANSGWDGAFGARRGYRSPPWRRAQRQPPRSCRRPACPRQGGIQLGCVNYAFVDTVERVAAWNYTTERDWREMSCWTHHWDSIMGPYLASGGLVNNGAAIRRNPRMFRYIAPGAGAVQLTAAEVNLANATDEPLRPCAGNAGSKAQAGPNAAARNKCVDRNYFSRNPGAAWGEPPRRSYCRHIAGASNMNTMVREMQMKVNNMDEYFLSKARLTTPDADGGWGGGQPLAAAVGIPNLIRGYVRFLRSPGAGGEPTQNRQAPAAVVWRGGPPYVSVNPPPDAVGAARAVAAGGAGFLGAQGQAMHHFAANAGVPAVMPHGFALQGTAAALHGQPWADAQLAAGNVGAGAPAGAASPDVQPGWHLLPAYLATSMIADVAMGFAGCRDNTWQNIPGYYGILQRIHVSAMIPYISYDQTPLTSQYGEREVLFCRNCIWVIPPQAGRVIPPGANPPGFPYNPHAYPVRVIDVYLLPPFNIHNMLNYRQSARIQFANLVVPPQRWDAPEQQALSALITRWAETRTGVAGLVTTYSGGGKKRRKQQKKRKKTRKKKSGGRKRKKTRRRKKRS